MKVKVFPADMGACGSYRVTWPAEVLAQQGEQVSVERSNGLPFRWRCRSDVSGLIGLAHHGSEWDTLNPPPCEEVGAVGDVDADVVVFQRIMNRWLVDAIPLLQAAGVAVVIEVDDLFDAVTPANPAFVAWHPKFSGDRNWRHLERACAMADLVTVTTPRLARRYGVHGRVRILPNYVPERYLRLATSDENDPLVIGWPGSVLTHPGDLEVTRGTVGSVAAQTGAVVRIVGSGAGAADSLGMDRADVLCSGKIPLDLYPRGVAQLDVGIAPLADSAFNDAKSWLKPLEMAAVGVPCVMSPTSQYRAIHDLGIGVLADRPREWERELRRLIADQAWRAEVRARGLRTAEAMTIEKHAWRWIEAWTDAAANRLLARIPTHAP